MDSASAGPADGAPNPQGPSAAAAAAPEQSNPVQSLPLAPHLQDIGAANHTRGQESFSRSRSSTGVAMDNFVSETPDDTAGVVSSSSDPAGDFNTAFAHQSAPGDPLADPVETASLVEEQQQHSKDEALQALDSWAQENETEEQAPFTPHLDGDDAPVATPAYASEPVEQSTIPHPTDSFATEVPESADDDDWAKAMGVGAEVANTEPAEQSRDAFTGDAALTQASVDESTDETMHELKEPLVQHGAFEAEPQAPADLDFLDAAKSVSADLQQPEHEQPREEQAEPEQADTSWLQSERPAETELEDSWAAAMKGSDGAPADASWEAAFGDALDEDGFLDDEDGFLDEDFAEDVSASQSDASNAANAYAPRTSSIPPPVQYSAPAYGAPPPVQPVRPPADRTASGGMKFFEDLPMTAPARRTRPKAAAPPGAPGPPAAAPPSRYGGPAVAVQPPPQTGRGLEMFPPQPTVPPQQPVLPPSSSTAGLRPMPANSTPPAASRYSPAPAAAPQGNSRYAASASAAPPASSAAQSQYSPALATTPQAPSSHSSATPNNYTPASSDSPYPSAHPPSKSVPSPPRANSRYSPAPKPSQTSATTNSYSPAQAPPTHEDSSSTSIPPSLASHRFAPRTSSPLASPEWRPKLDRSATAPSMDDMLSSGRPSTGDASAAIPAPSFPPQSQSFSTGEASHRRPRTQSPETTKAKPRVISSDIKSPAQFYPQQSTPGMINQPLSSTMAPHSPDGAFNFMDPADPMLASDPLKRWSGAPIFRWSTGGLVSVHFPKHVPMYGGGQTAPSIKSSPGEVRLDRIKSSIPVDETFVSFPGPLRSKSKKKELLTWLTTRIEAQQREVSSISVDMMNPRPSERLILWQLLRIFVEHDGALTGNPTVDMAVRSVLSTPADRQEPAQQPDPSPKKSEAVEAAVLHEIRQLLVAGDRDKAAWLAADNRLWGHAMIIASTAPDGVLWKQVAQEFVRNEVRSSTQDTKSLAAAYEIFAHNWDESIDELVPASARAGFQMMPRADGSGPSQNALDGLNKWQQTVSMVLSNRSAEDERGLLALGKLLRGYGRVEAAHICFLFARGFARPGGLDDEEADFTLLGADVSHDALHDTDAILLSEVFEFGLSLIPGAMQHHIPHLQAYKLHHAHVLADSGHRDTAMAYCDNISAAIKSMTRPSPYYHPALIAELDDLQKTLSATPKDGAGSWMSKPSLNKVSGSMWAKFNTFVTGEDDAASNASGAHSETEAGPFGRLSGTPSISRSASVADLSASFSPMNPAPAAGAAGGNSRYAPSYAPQAAQPAVIPGPYQPASAASSFSPTSAPRDIPRSGPANPYNPYQPALGISDTASQVSSSYDPPILQPPSSQHLGLDVGSPSLTYASSRATSSHGPPSHHSQEHDMSVIEEEVTPRVNGFGPVNGYEPPSHSYEPPPATGPITELNETEGYNPPAAGASYEPPSGGYQPYDPLGPSSPQDDAPKKKSMMDDDGDDLTDRAEAIKRAERAKRDREADELFRKTAEAESKRDKDKDDRRASGGWFGGWFKKDPNAPTVHKAKLGEESSFYYDPDTKKWVNKKAGADASAQAAAPTPPPPRAGPPMGGRASASPGLPSTGPPPSAGLPPGTPGTPGTPPLGAGPPGGPPSRTATPADAPPAAGPPSRPPTSMSNASSIDDLLGAPAARRPAGGAGKKGKKGGRYVDVMAKTS